MFSTNASADMAVVGVLSPQTVASTELFTNVIDMSQWSQVVATALLGNMASETIDFKAYTCASDGSSKVALKNTTQLGASATANDNKQLVLQVRDSEVARYVVFGLVTGGVTGGPAAVVVHGVDPHYAPASNNDLASVVQIKV